MAVRLFFCDKLLGELCIKKAMNTSFPNYLQRFAMLLTDTSVPVLVVQSFPFLTCGLTELCFRSLSRVITSVSIPDIHFLLPIELH